jgi:hypothetical protein
MISKECSQKKLFTIAAQPPIAVGPPIADASPIADEPPMAV